MKWIKRILWGMIILEIGLLLYKYVPPETSKSILSMVLPGYETCAFSDLDPTFQTKLSAVFKNLGKQGYHPKVYSAYRSSELQEFYFSSSKKLRNAGFEGITKARGGQSCHNKVDANGNPASMAADVWGAPYGAFLSLKLDLNFRAHVRFFKALGEEVEQQGLLWGGDWTSTSSVWSSEGLGWDPAHVQMGSCL